MARLRLDKPSGDGSPKNPTDRSASAVKARRWHKELDLAGKREKDWRQISEKIVKRYRGEEKKRNRYNILWANTDVLAPAIFNSAPEPDVRRRFRDNDPLGRAVGEVLERSLSVMCDGDMTVDAIKADVLDALLPGRGVSRIRYVPQLGNKQAGVPAKAKGEESAQDEADSAVTSSQPSEPGEGAYSEVEFEQVQIEHVDWQDFRHGYGRTWVEVPWVAFRHKISRKDAVEKFGKEQIEGIEFTVQTKEDGSREHQYEQGSAKLAEFWEVWSKDDTEVFFISENSQTCIYPKDNPKGEPPLQLEGFFPCPKPLMLVENIGSLQPIPIFHLYEDQANELDKLTLRIDKIINALKLRGIYDSSMKEIKDVLVGDDNDLTPVQNAAKYLQAGGLEKGITWFPVDQAAKVLESLYDARDRQLKIIDMLLGISDIVRGVTDPDETLGAQKMKGGYFSIRLWRYQQEVKRYGRDLLRLAAGAMAQMFSAQTFAAMTDLNFPSQADKLQIQHQLQPPAAPQMPGAPPAPPPPPPDPNLVAVLKLPTWEDIIGMMHSPSLRQFRTDIETDSMIAGTLESDMAGLSEILEAIIKFMEGISPIVVSGALPADSAKELVMAVIRRAKLGSAVEDAFDKMTQPKPPQPPPEPSIQVAQINAQKDEKLEQLRQQGEAQKLQATQAHEEKMVQFKAQADAQLAAATNQLEATKHSDQITLQAQTDNSQADRQAQMDALKEQHETQRMQMQHDLDRYTVDANNRTKLEIAAMQASATAEQQSAQFDHELQTAAVKGDKDLGDSPSEGGNQNAQQMQGMLDAFKALTEHMNRPRKIIRDENGRMTGVQ